MTKWKSKVCLVRHLIPHCAIESSAKFYLATPHVCRRENLTTCITCIDSKHRFNLGILSTSSLSFVDNSSFTSELYLQLIRNPSEPVAST